MSSIEKSIPIQKMNSTNLYVTMTQIIMKSDPKNPNSWQDLYRIVPYLGNSLTCVVCSHLLVDPLTPTIAQCRHHLCRQCEGGRKNIKPACEGCKDCKDYTDNKQLRILLQCYKKMCIYVINSPLFKSITIQASQPGTGFERDASNLILLIREGASFQDEYKSKGGLSKSTYSILPCIYNKSATVNTQSVQPQTTKDNSNVVLNSDLQNRSSFSSVLCPSTGSKITLKRNRKEAAGDSPKVATNRQNELTEKASIWIPFIYIIPFIYSLMNWVKY